MITSISPIDGRYAKKTEELKEFFSEAALIKYRILVEVKYLKHLSTLSITQLDGSQEKAIMDLVEGFSAQDAQVVKDIEKTTNHDVKAVEYFIKDKLQHRLNGDQLEKIHLGLTSQDINNTAMPLMLMHGTQIVMLPVMEQLMGMIKNMAEAYATVPLLSRTHGQAASPSTIGKEMRVYLDRLEKQIGKIKNHSYEAKFGGATGNFNAHRVAYPQINWPETIDEFIDSMGLKRQQYTTQIDQYDHFAELFHHYSRFNTILIDFAQDIWTYVSRDYFKQKVIANEVGSSAMPHKVNPIDFENAEGNLALANALLEFLARKLPVSRLQRDLTDSTVTRNIGVPLSHSLIAYKSLIKGISKLEINESALKHDLEKAWAVVSEGIQTILRREGFEKPYELLKAFSRGKGQLSKEDFITFIDSLDVSPQIKEELRAITPHNYLGYSIP